MTAGLGVGGILRAAGKSVTPLPSTRPYFSPNTSRWSILMESRSIINYVTETRSGLYDPPRWDPRSYLQSRDDHHMGTGLSQHTHQLSCEAAGLKGTGYRKCFGIWAANCCSRLGSYPLEQQTWLPSPMTTHFRRSAVCLKSLHFFQASLLNTFRFIQQTSNVRSCEWRQRSQAWSWFTEAF